MIIKMPEGADGIITTLINHGHEAFIVGGCVRDSLLGLEPHDWDICTSATPDEMKQCFGNYHVIETGLKHGTLTVVLDGEQYEVTTYRVDGEYSDNRHPDVVRFVTDIKSDLSRRDFTINSMAYGVFVGLIDYFDGEQDLKQKVIRCVGNPNDRFREDALRIMRALRFASTYRFSIEKQTAASIHELSHLLKNIAVERINVELSKLLCGVGAKNILRDYIDVLGIFIPELLPMVGFNQNNPHHIYDVWNHTTEAVKNAENVLVIKLAALLHDVGKPHCYTEDEQGIGHFYGHANISMDITETVLKRLKFDNDTIHNVVELVKYHDADIQPRNKHVKRWLNKIGEDGLKRLVALKRADVMAQSELDREERLIQLDDVLMCIETVIAQQQCFSLKDLAVNGRDLMDTGVPQGVQIGVVLNGLLDMVLDEQIENDQKALLEAVKSL